MTNEAALAALQAESAQARLTLAHTDLGSLPNDWTLQQIAEARIDDLLTLRDQVRDTCRRAETAEARIAELEAALEPFAHSAGVIIPADGDDATVIGVRIGDLRRARAALAKGGP
jgi:hypothetical protein